MDEISDGVYRPSGRGIAVRETLVRILPTDDPAYDDPLRSGRDTLLTICRCPLSVPAPLWIFLPGNSAAQILSAARIVDLSQENTSTRLRYLTEHGRPFSTLVNIPRHIMLYTGNTVINGQTVPMTYQNIWGDCVRKIQTAEVL